MLFCQFAHARSLREIDGGLSSCEGKFKHLGVAGAQGRSILSNANAHRFAHLFEKLFYQVLGNISPHAPVRKFRFKSKLYSLDSTVIDLCASMFDWAKFRATKGAAKLHVFLDHDGHLPCYARVFGGGAANSRASGMVNVSGNTLLADVDDNDVTGVGSLTINGGTVNVNIGASATQGIRDNSNKTTGTNAASGTTTLTLQGGTLNLNGGIIGGDNAVRNKFVDTLNFRSGTLQNVLQINNGGGLAKTSNGTGSGGTLILSGTSSYTGATNVNAGTLLVSGTHSNTTGGTGYTVNNAGTTLGGTGRLAVNGNVSVASAAILAPGASIGTLTLNGLNTAGNVLTMTTGSTFGFELAGNGGVPDRLDFWNYLTGDLALNTIAIDLTLIETLAPGTYNVDIFPFFSDGGAIGRRTDGPTCMVTQRGLKSVPPPVRASR